jgi:Bacterial SH3 domain
VSFPIALDGTDGVPSRSVIAIRGLPQGSNFSEGRPYGGSEWNLKPDQIGDLALVLPADANGEFKLGIALIGPDDRVIAETETLLEIAPAPAEQAAPEESSVPSPDGSGAATSAPVPDDNEPAASAPVPDAGHGDGAEPEKKPTIMEAATAPSGDAPPDAVEPTEDGKGRLGTVQPSVFVNLREAPASSAPVLGVVAKGAELQVLDRKRGWVQVTDPETGKKGWIYSGLLAGEAKTHHRIRRVAPAEAESKSESFWSRLGGWLSP